MVDGAVVRIEVRENTDIVLERLRRVFVPPDPLYWMKKPLGPEVAVGIFSNESNGVQIELWIQDQAFAGPLTPRFVGRLSPEGQGAVLDGKFVIPGYVPGLLVLVSAAFAAMGWVFADHLQLGALVAVVSLVACATPALWFALVNGAARATLARHIRRAITAGAQK